MKIVLNASYWGFNLSNKALELYKQKTWKDINKFGRWLERSDSALVEIIELLWVKASWFCAKLIVVEVEDKNYTIKESDWRESV